MGYVGQLRLTKKKAGENKRTISLPHLSELKRAHIPHKKHLSAETPKLQIPLWPQFLLLLFTEPLEFLC